MKHAVHYRAVDKVLILGVLRYTMFIYSYLYRLWGHALDYSYQFLEVLQHPLAPTCLRPALARAEY